MLLTKGFPRKFIWCFDVVNCKLSLDFVKKFLTYTLSQAERDNELSRESEKFSIGLEFRLATAMRFSEVCKSKNMDISENYNLRSIFN